MSGHVSNKTKTPNGTYVPLPPGLNECGACGWDFCEDWTRDRHIETRIAQGDETHINIFREELVTA